MPLSSNDEDETQGNAYYTQLAFPFEVQRIKLPPERDRYSLAPIDDPCPEGGGFIYENCPEIFLGRVGYGPLRVAWDTNIIIDYAEYGDLIWKSEDEDVEFDPRISETCYRNELVALNEFMHLWLMRDIRVRVPARQVFDARRDLDDATWELRERQVHHFLAALRCIELDKEIIENMPPFDVLNAESTNDQWDESLVLEAIENGCHVFLTRDSRLRRRLYQMAHEAFMIIMPPSELIQKVSDAGELGFGGPGYIFPDTHKWEHFVRATKNS